MAGRTNELKKLFVSLVAVGALAAPAGWISQAGAQSDPDANGDVHSNCHTGSKGLGAGGEDRPKEHGNGEARCGEAPVPEGPAAAPGAPAAGPGAQPGAATAAAPATAVRAAPRVTG